MNIDAILLETVDTGGGWDFGNYCFGGGDAVRSKICGESQRYTGQFID